MVFGHVRRLPEEAPGWMAVNKWAVYCCCCGSPAALLLSSVVQVEEVCDRSRVVPQVLHCKLRRMALTVEQMLYLRSVVPLHTPDRHLICRWWCGPCNYIVPTLTHNGSIHLGNRDTPGSIKWRSRQESLSMLHGTLPSTVADGGHYDSSWSRVTDDDNEIIVLCLTHKSKHMDAN